MNSNKFQVTGTPEYDRHFWNAMRGVKESVSNLESGRNSLTGAFALPNSAHNNYMAALAQKSLFRQIGTPIEAYHSGYRIFAHDCDDVAAWIPENGSFPITDATDDFTRYPVEKWKFEFAVFCV